MGRHARSCEPLATLAVVGAVIVRVLLRSSRETWHLSWLRRARGGHEGGPSDGPSSLVASTVSSREPEATLAPEVGRHARRK